MVRGKTGLLLGSGGSIAEPPILLVRALDVATGARRWEYRAPHSELFDHSGLLATAGGVVFGLSGGVLFALDAATGQELWRVLAWRKHSGSPDLIYVGRATGDRCVGGPGTDCVWLVGIELRGYWLISICCRQCPRQERGQQARVRLPMLMQ